MANFNWMIVLRPLIRALTIISLRLDEHARRRAEQQKQINALRARDSGRDERTRRRE